MPASGVEIIHPVPLEAVPGFMRASATTFLGDPTAPTMLDRIGRLTQRWDPERAWAARDQNRWVATLRTEPRSITVPGLAGGTRELAADAVTAVTVAATHRRRGLMRQMLYDSLRAAQVRGDAISVLIAAEWPIYGRFGYAPATWSAEYILRSSRAGARLAGDPARVRQVERDEFAEAAPAVFDAARRQRAGQMDRDRQWWDGLLGRDDYAPSESLARNLFVHDGDDGPDGLVGWTPHGEFGMVPPLGSVEVSGLVTASQAAYRDLWTYLSGIDGIDEVTVPLRPLDEPVRWLLQDARTLVARQQFDFLWLRLLDVPAALTARRYATAGDIVFEVVDDDGVGFATGRYRLRADGDEVECRRTDRDPDLQIAQRALASMYLGGVRLIELQVAGAVQEYTPGAMAEMDVMFATALAPWNATWF